MQTRSSRLAATLAILTLAACGREDDALTRGHGLWADSAYSEALAEYRLALERSGGRTEILALVAHGFAVTGQLERARDAYAELIAREERYRDQAVFDFLSLARRSVGRRDQYAMARAVDAAVELQPGAWPPDLAGPLARYYAESGERARAVQFFELALVHSQPDEARDFLFELGRIRQEQGECGSAVGYFDAYLQRWPDGPRRSDARWHVGTCSFELAREAHSEGQLTRALERLATVTSLGVPENLQDQAWFERGEILFALGRDDEALASYMRVVELNPARQGQLVQRAQLRIDQIRFGT